MEFSFDSFVNRTYDYDYEEKKHSGLWLRDENMDIGGGRISFADIDRFDEYPDADTVMISGLRQDTFEYFIGKYGRRLRAIRFFKNKFIEDLSPLGDLPGLEYVYFFANQRVTSLWDMSGNASLTGVALFDFSRLSDLTGIGRAPALKDFRIGNKVWSKAVIDSFLPFSGTAVEKLSFSGRAIKDNDLSFLDKMPALREFDFPTNLYTTAQVAWIAANFPELEGFALGAKVDITAPGSDEDPEVIIVGKGKPHLIVRGNEKRIGKYEAEFEALKERYRGVPYHTAFLD